MRLRFNQLPELDIIEFINMVNVKENLNIPRIKIEYIQKLYNSDIRSMINYIQSNQNIIHEHNVVDISVWEELTEIIKNYDSYKKGTERLEEISNKYNIEIKNIIKDYLNYIIRFKSNFVCKDFLNFTEFIMHLTDANTEHIKIYTIERLHNLFCRENV